MNQAEKTDRAFHAYVDLLDAADAMRSRVSGQLAVYGLTMNGFRVLELLSQEGPMRATAVAERLRLSRGNLDVIVKRVIEKGWVESVLLPASGRDEVARELLPTDEVPQELPDESERRGGAGSPRRFCFLKLTDEGQEFIRRFLPRHGKVVKAFMRALDGREQDTLSYLCRKLTEGDVLKFLSEMEHEGT